MAQSTRWAALAAVLLVMGCKTSLPPYDYSKEPDPRKSNRGFVLGPADAIRIDVWGQNALSTAAVVRPDGIITMPLVGDLRASGKTPAALRKEIEGKLANYIKDSSAKVTVAVTSVQSYRFTISGNVARPGIQTSARFVTVQEAISMAGGPTRFADARMSVILRKSPGGKIRRIPIDVPAVLAGKSPQMNLVLLRGDVLHVP
jgi:polysaccharide export outer membrane protein